MFDALDYMFYERYNDKDLEMKDQGFKFITNFTLEREEPYRKAAELHNLRYSFENEIYGMGGKLGNDGKWMKAFYVDVEVRDLTDFWDTVRVIQEANK